MKRCIPRTTLLFCLLALIPSLWTRAPEALATMPVTPDQVSEAFTLIQRGDNYRLHISFPATGNALADAELDIWARRRASLFIRGVEDLPTSFPFELSVTYRLFRPSANAVSVAFLVSTYMGGDQPEAGMMTFSYDTRNGRRLALLDVFRREAGLLRFLSRYCRDDLDARLGSRSVPAMLESGTREEMANFDLFSLEASGLIIHFPPLQVAPLAEGYLEVHIPLDELAEFLPDLSLWGRGGSR